MEKSQITEKITRKVGPHGSWKLANGKYPVFVTEEWRETFNPILRVWERTGEIEKKYLTPKDLGYSKEEKIYVLFVRKLPSRTSWKGFDEDWFVEEITVQIRKDRPFFYLLWNDADNQLYVKNVLTTQCGRCPTDKSSAFHIVSRKEPQHLTEKEKEKLLEKQKHVFVVDRRMEDGVSGEIIYGKFIEPVA